MTKLKELKKRFMEDPEFREAYASVDKEYTLVETRVRERAAENPIRAEGAPHSNAGWSAPARPKGGSLLSFFASLSLVNYAKATIARPIRSSPEANGSDPAQIQRYRTPKP